MELFLSFIKNMLKKSVKESNIMLQWNLNIFGKRDKMENNLAMKSQINYQVI